MINVKINWQAGDKMQTAQLRDIVIDKIYGINDLDYLKAIKKILDMSQPSCETFHLSKEQKDLIDIGRQQISRGEYISNEELEKEENQWLNE
jgi:hypothetical protein